MSITIHERVQTDSAFLRLSGMPTGRRVVHIGASGDFHIAVADSTPTTAYLFVESNGRNPFTLVVDDMNDIWVSSPGGTNYITIASYPVNSGPVPM
jgi:hypothetical protein